MTGGIGSGKTTVGLLFQAYGTPLIDADTVARQICHPGEPAYNAIVSHFSSQCLNEDNTLNRHWLRHRIFKSVSDKQTLEKITHPLIFDAINAWYQQQVSVYCIVVVPLLVETSRAGFFDRVLVIDCSLETQITRIIERNNFSENEAKRIISQQASREDRLQFADDVILNQQDLSTTLVKDVEKLHNLYLSIPQTTG